MIDQQLKEDPNAKLSYFDTCLSYDVVPDRILLNKTNKIVKETMFDNNYSPEIRQELKKCLRVFPHHQDTSGFFITIIEKVKDFPGAILTDPTASPLEKLPLSIQDKKPFSFVRCDTQDPDF